MNIWSKLSSRLPFPIAPADKANFLFQLKFSGRQLQFSQTKESPPFINVVLKIYTLKYHKTTFNYSFQQVERDNIQGKQCI